MVSIIPRDLSGVVSSSKATLFNPIEHLAAMELIGLERKFKPQPLTGGFFDTVKSGLDIDPAINGVTNEVHRVLNAIA